MVREMEPLWGCSYCHLHVRDNYGNSLPGALVGRQVHGSVVGRMKPV